MHIAPTRATFFSNEQNCAAAASASPRATATENGTTSKNPTFGVSETDGAQIEKVSLSYCTIAKLTSGGASTQQPKSWPVSRGEIPTLCASRSSTGSPSGQRLL